MYRFSVSVDDPPVSSGTAIDSTVGVSNTHTRESCRMHTAVHTCPSLPVLPSSSPPNVGTDYLPHSTQPLRALCCTAPPSPAAAAPPRPSFLLQAPATAICSRYLHHCFPAVLLQAPKIKAPFSLQHQVRLLHSVNPAYRSLFQLRPSHSLARMATKKVVEADGVSKKLVVVGQRHSHLL